MFSTKHFSAKYFFGRERKGSKDYSGGIPDPELENLTGVALSSTLNKEQLVKLQKRYGLKRHQAH